MKKKLFTLLLALVAIATTAQAQKITTWETAGLPVTFEEFVASAGTGNRYVFRMPSNSSRGWCNFTTKAAAAATDVTIDDLFSIETSTTDDTAFKLKRFKDGKYLLGTSSSSEWVAEDEASDLYLENRTPRYSDPEDAEGYGVEENAPHYISMDDASGNHFNNGNFGFRPGVSGWSAYFAYGPIYVVKVNCIDEHGDEVSEPLYYFGLDGATISITTPKFLEYSCAEPEATITVNGADEEHTFAYTHTDTFDYKLTVINAPEGTKLKIFGKDVDITATEYSSVTPVTPDNVEVILPDGNEYVFFVYVEGALITVKCYPATAILNALNFPDANFRVALVSKLGIDEGDVITDEMVAATTSLSVDGKSITNLTGIEHFTALKTLHCYDNQLTSLDVSKNTALQTLRCQNNQLTSLDVSGCTALTRLDCYSNQIKGTMMDALVASLPMVDKGTFNVIDWENEKNICTSIQVAIAREKGWRVYHYNYGDPFIYEGSEPDLEDYENGIEINEVNFPDPNFRYYLSGLNWAKNGFFSDNEIKQIKEMDISGRSIEDLTGIEHFTALTKLICNGTSWQHVYGKGLLTLNVSKNTSLKHLSCNYNMLTSLDLSNNIELDYLDCSQSPLTSLDLSNNTALKFLYCNFSQLTSLDVSKNTALEYLNCGSNQLTTLDLSNNTALEYLNCESNLLTTLDISKNIELKGLFCKLNHFTSLDFSGHPSLTFLNCSDYETPWHTPTLTSLNVSNCLKLKSLYCEGYYNSRGVLSTLNAWNCVSLDSLNCLGNQLTLLTVLDCPSLKYLVCSFNQLAGLDVSGKQYLTEVKCSNNQLLSLNVRDCAKLKKMDCGYNHISSLSVSTNIALAALYCANNQLTELNVTKNKMLEVLQCDNNQLTTLDVSENGKLHALTCSRNYLKTLDASKNGALVTLRCNNNQLTSFDFSGGQLNEVTCYSNRIGSIAMGEIVNKLPKSNVWGGQLTFIAIDTKDGHERNVCTKTQVSIAAKKDWVVYDYNGGNEKPYEGREPFHAVPLTENNFRDKIFRETLSEILNVNEGDDITEEIIEKTTTLDVSDKSIADLSGIEYFTALTTLYCHINQIKNEEMTALIAALPDLSSNEAKGMMRAEETNLRAGALYALDHTDENEQNVCTAEHVATANAKGWTVYCKTANGWQEYNGEIPTGIDASLNDNGQMINDSWYTIDGVKLNGEPTQKGVYIIKGKKVVK